MRRSNLGCDFAVAASAGVMYDWALTFTQEVELIWRHRWSSMTVLYLGARYLGISYSVINILLYVPTISMTDVVCHIMYVVQAWIGVVISAVLGFIIIARLHAMYRRSRKVLIFLATIFLVVNVSNGVITAIIMMRSSGEERILSGTSHCSVGFDNHDRLLVAVTWALITAWETIALCFAGWIAAKHFRELRQSTGWLCCYFLFPPQLFVSNNLVNVHRNSDLSLSNILAGPDVCAGATLDHWCSRTSR
ncbi:hypothetical protein BDR05DRAFT_98836 [Suillus weaverae]|nr:hypothetical protein BDR05DRAFT_98836 [Suillus weaverae]